MEVILREDVLGVGDIGEKVSVKAGYARNYLVPQGLAVETGSRRAKTVAHELRQIEAKKKSLLAGAQEIADKIEKTEVELSLRVGKGGKVFGSVSSKDIASKLQAADFDIDRRRVLLEEPIKKIGTHFVSVKLHPEVKAQLKVVIEKADATKEEEAQETQAAKAKFEKIEEESLEIPTEE